MANEKDTISITVNGGLISAADIERTVKHSQSVHEAVSEFGTSPGGAAWDSGRLHDWQRRIEERVAALEGRTSIDASKSQEVAGPPKTGKRISVNDAKDGE